MELINELNEDYWSRGDPNQTAGYRHYRVMKCEKLDEPGSFSYGIFDDDGMLKKVTLQNGASSRDPLSGICNILLKLSDDGHQITGVIVEDDCVTLKSNADRAEPVPNGGSDVNGEMDDVSKGQSTSSAGVPVTDDLNAAAEHASDS